MQTDRVPHCENEPPAKRQRTDFVCDCGTEFSERRALVQHQKTAASCPVFGKHSRDYHCDCCNAAFARKDVRDKHRRRKHGSYIATGEVEPLGQTSHDQNILETDRIRLSRTITRDIQATVLDQEAADSTVNSTTPAQLSAQRKAESDDALGTQLPSTSQAAAPIVQYPLVEHATADANHDDRRTSPTDSGYGTNAPATDGTLQISPPAHRASWSDSPSSYSRYFPSGTSSPRSSLSSPQVPDLQRFGSSQNSGASYDSAPTAQDATVPKVPSPTLRPRHDSGCQGGDTTIVSVDASQSSVSAPDGQSRAEDFDTGNTHSSRRLSLTAGSDYMDLGTPRSSMSLGWVAELDDPFYDLVDPATLANPWDAHRRSKGHMMAILPEQDAEMHDALAELRPSGDSTEDHHDSVSVSSTSSRSSARKMLARMRSRTQRPRPRGLAANKLLTRDAQLCSKCKKPYEKDDTELRKHLDSHIAELKAEDEVPTCVICQVGFIHDEDIQHHLRSAESGKCGFNFHHASLCTGHHPPITTIDGVWSDHDRFSYGHLLRGWENAQVSQYMAEIDQVMQLRNMTKTRSKHSLPELRFLQRLSQGSMVASLFSWHSEPTHMKSELDIIQEGLASVELNGPPPRQRGNLLHFGERPSAALHGLQTAVQGGGLQASLIRLGVMSKPTLTLAIEQGKYNVVDALLHAGLPVTPHHLYRAAFSGNQEIVELLLSWLGTTHILDLHGSMVLQLAVRSGCTGTVGAVLRRGVDPNCGPWMPAGLWRTFPLVDNGYFASMLDPPGSEALMSRASLTHDSPLYAAVVLGHTTIVSLLLTAGANIDSSGSFGSALGASVAHERPDCANALLAVEKHIRYEQCWEGLGVLELVASRDDLEPRLIEALMVHCKQFDHRQCRHADELVHAAIRCGKRSLIEIARRHGSDIRAFDARGNDSLRLIYCTCTDEGILKCREAILRAEIGEKIDLLPLLNLTEDIPASEPE